MFWLYLLSPIVTVVLLYFVLYELAKDSVLFTFVESGNIKYFYVGDTLKKVVADVEGKTMDRFTLRDKTAKDKDNRSWPERALGLYWVGFPPYAKVYKFMVPRRKEAEDLTGLPLKEWISNGPPKEVDSLRSAFIRPISIEKAELGDRQTVDLLVSGKFEVVDAYIPVPQLKGDFWTLLESLWAAAVLDIIENTTTMDDWIKADKGDNSTSSVLRHLWEKDSDFNKNLILKTGIQIVGASIPRWDPSDPTIREAMQIAFKASKEQEGEVVRAETLRITTEAAAKAKERLAQARGAEIRETLEGFASNGANKETAAQAAAAVLRAQAVAGPDSKITTLVDGQAPVVVPLPGGTK